MGSVRLQPDLSGGAPMSMPARTAEAFEFFNRTSEARGVGIVEVDLIPADAIAVRATRERHAEMADREPLDERGRPDVEFADNPVVVLALGAQLFDATEDRAVERTHLAAEQQLRAKLIFFRHAGLLESSR